jgi:hypothetical protein
MYGVGCNAENDQLWKQFDIPAISLPEWIERSIREGIYQPGECDIIIVDRDRLTAHLCHEADIHIETKESVIVQDCADRWLNLGYRLLRTDATSPSCKNWREVRSVAEL